MAEKIYHYPLWIRLWHVANALLCLALIISGISMQFSEPDRPLIRFDMAVTLHNSAAILLTINYLFFLIANRLSGNKKHYKISREKLYRYACLHNSDTILPGFLKVKKHLSR